MAKRVQLGDIGRHVYGILGLPIDAIDLEFALQRVDCAVQARASFLLSTPNVNFLIISRADPEFRESLLMSDLCPVDGMPLVWIGRLLGVPLRMRLSGSDIFDALRSRCSQPKLKVFLFGGAEGVASHVSEKLNQNASGLVCVGALNPGFGSVSEMSTEAIFQSINASSADLLTVFLSARKAQAWLLKNHDRLTVPFRAQFGATINLQAGRVKRAPPLLRKLSLEWLWRIKEEPYLWRRYLSDGLRLLSILLTSVIPLVLGNILSRRDLRAAQFKISQYEEAERVLIKIGGPAIARHIDAAINCFGKAATLGKPVVLDMSETTTVDPRFFGLLLMLRKQATCVGLKVQLVNLTPRIRRLFRLNGFSFLLSP